MAAWLFKGLSCFIFGPSIYEATDFKLSVFFIKAFLTSLRLSFIAVLFTCVVAVILHSVFLYTHQPFMFLFLKKCSFKPHVHFNWSFNLFVLRVAFWKWSLYIPYNITNRTAMCRYFLPFCGLLFIRCPLHQGV